MSDEEATEPAPKRTRKPKAAATKSAAEIMGLIMAEIGSLPKDGYNKHFKYHYTTAESAITAVRNQLIAHGVYVDRDLDNSFATCTDRGTVIYQWAGALVFPDDTRIHMCGSGEGKDSADKGTMKAETAAFKYALAGTFLIGWGDDDPEASHNDASAAPAKAAAAKKKGATKATTKKAAAKPAASKDEKPAAKPAPAGTEDKFFNAARKLIETTDDLPAALEKVKKSKKLTDQQKIELAKIAKGKAEQDTENEE